MSTNREASLDRLRGAVERGRRGESSVVLVHGGMGVGKSWLLGRLIDEVAPESTLRLLHCTGHPAESDLPYAGLHQLVSPLLHRLPELPQLHADAISAALALGSSKTLDRLAVSVGLLGLLTLEAEQRTVLVVVDDVHWLDNSTTRALTFAARRLDADAVAMVFSSRSGAGDIGWAAGFDRIELGPLDTATSRALLRQAHPELSAAVTARVLNEADGLPLALLQIPADLTAEQRAGSAALPTVLPPGTALDEFYRGRLSSLGGDGRRALALASLDDLTIDQLGAALAGVGLTLATLETAETSGLIRLAPDGYGFPHPTVRSAAQRAASFAELQRAHAAIVDALPATSTRAAWHLEALASGTNAATADALGRAALDAWGRSAYEEAGRAWSASAVRCPDPAVAHQRRGRAVDAYLRLGSFAPLAELLPKLQANAADAAEKAQWQAVHLVAGLFSGAEPPPYAEVRDLAQSIAEAAPEAASRLLSTYALILIFDGETRLACAVVDELRAMLPDHQFSLADRLVHDDAEMLAGRPGAGAFLRSDWPERLSDAELCDPSIPVASPLVHLAWMGDAVRAGATIDRQYEALQAGGGVSLIDLCLAQRAVIAQLTGNWDEAHAAFSGAGDLSRASDFAAPMPHIRLRHAYLLAARGDEAQVREIVAEMAALAGSDRPIHRHLSGCVLGLLALTLGRHEEAVGHLQDAGALEHRMGIREPGFDSRFGDLFESAWRMGTQDQLQTELDDFEERARTASRHSASAVALRCRAMVAPPEQLDAAFAEALAMHDRVPYKFEIARTHLAWGRRLRRERRKADARAPLHQALTAFQALGARPWVSAVLEELAACGERHTAAASGALSTLTPRELAVAMAVAGGASNTEAAARLFVSRRTVEHHLGSVFRKLGVRNRAQLAERIAE
ncbi:helix-turn-helix transcriptional regulator [Homoserinimonas sp. A447]